MAVKETRISIIVNDQALAGLRPENGLALSIENDGRQMFFDSGGPETLLSNSRHLGLDLSKTELLMLSHGHFCHCDALPELVKFAPDINVYCHAEALRPRYRIQDGKAESLRMSSACLQALSSLDRRQLHWVSSPARLGEEMGLTGSVPQVSSYEDSGGPFFLDLHGQVPDPFDDDQAFWIRKNNELIVCVGFCHAGLINTLHYIMHLTNCYRIKVIIGSFQLFMASQERLDWTLQALKLLEVERIISCHCCDAQLLPFMQKHIDATITPGLAGSSFLF